MSKRSGPVGTEDLSPELIARCEARVGYTFSNKLLLQAALTHASGALHRLKSNERLEFLGDAILGFVVCELLFHLYPDYLEGDLTKIKSVVVSRTSCAKISQELQLQEFLILGKGMTTHPRVPPSLLADVFESLIAAIYLDGGETAVREFIHRYVGPEIEAVAAGRSGGQLQIGAAANGAARFWHHADVFAVGRKGPRPQQVLQDFSAGRQPPLSRSLGTQQEGSGAVRGPQCPVRNQRRGSAVPFGLINKRTGPRTVRLRFPTIAGTQHHRRAAARAQTPARGVGTTCTLDRSGPRGRALQSSRQAPYTR